MTKIKLCGLTRLCDIEAVNALKPEYIGFVFAPGSKRYIDAKAAAGLKKMLHAEIQAVGVFVNEPVEFVAGLLRSGVIDMAQLHGGESETIHCKTEKTERPTGYQGFSRCERAGSCRRAKQPGGLCFAGFRSGYGPGV